MGTIYVWLQYQKYLSRPCTLADKYHRTVSFEQNLLIYYTTSKQDSEMNDTSFESPISELLDLVIKVGVGNTKRLPHPLE